MVTLGTGIGAGIIRENRICTGAHGCAGEIGRLSVEEGVPARAEEPVLEQYASARGIVLTMLEESGSAFLPDHDADAFSVFEEFIRGSAAAHRSVDRFCDALAFGLASAACAIGPPHHHTLGGGVSESFDLFSEKLRRDFKRYAILRARTHP